MIKITVKKLGKSSELKEYNITEQQLEEIKQKTTPNIELKEGVGWTLVAIHVGEFLVGYCTSKILDKILEKKWSGNAGLGEIK